MRNVYKTVAPVIRRLAASDAPDTIFNGDAIELAHALPSESIDLIFSSPPYCMGKAYESSSSVEDFTRFHEMLVPELIRILKPGGSVCWQVGYHVRNAIITPLDFLAHDIFRAQKQVVLRNRIVWSFAHGLHARKRFSGRHEVILWYTKGDSVEFNLDPIRVPQKYPGKKAYKGPNRGKLSGNPLGKNPGDVWAFPNVKGCHIEKTIHPCQFPVALPLMFVQAVCPAGGVVLDPFMGVGSTGMAAALEGARFVGAELVGEYVEIARKRIAEARSGRAVYRPINQPIHEPRPTDAVARRPAHFRGTSDGKGQEGAS